MRQEGKGEEGMGALGHRLHEVPPRWEEGGLEAWERVPWVHWKAATEKVYNKNLAWGKMSLNPRKWSLLTSS